MGPIDPKYADLIPRCDPPAPEASGAPPGPCPAPVPYPVLLVNIGSGVSIVLVEASGAFRRVSGSCLGGATWHGLARLIAPGHSYGALRDLAGQGDFRRTDLLVGDIYGAECAALGLPADLVAASFGKAEPAPAAPDPGPDDRAAPLSPSAQHRADLLASLGFMLGNNAAQTACLVADQHAAQCILYTGGLLMDHEALWQVVDFGTRFWSGGRREARLVADGAFLGALGGVLAAADPAA